MSQEERVAKEVLTILQMMQDAFVQHGMNVAIMGSEFLHTLLFLKKEVDSDAFDIVEHYAILTCNANTTANCLFFTTEEEASAMHDKIHEVMKDKKMSWPDAARSISEGQKQTRIITIKDDRPVGGPNAIH